MTNTQQSKHWSVIVLVMGVVVFLLISLLSYQIHHTEHAVVLRFGQPMPDRDTSPGLHYKLPFETVWRVDNRIHCTDGSAGVLEEVFTRDEMNIIVSVYVCWRVSPDKIVQFLESVKTVERGEIELTTLLRSYKNGVFGKYDLASLINTDRSKVRMKEIEDEIRGFVAGDADRLYGIEVTSVGIKHIGFPESVTSKIYQRMNSERQAEAERVLSEAEAIAMKIRAEADKDRELILAEAESKAKQARASGDAEAAEYYKVFQKNPELAEFLRKQESLRKALSEKTTLILDTETVPFDLLKKDALQIERGQSLEQ